MDIARYSIKRSTSSWLFLLILLVGGVIALQELGRLEDPEFTLKKAMVITTYPGASAQQVEEEVTYPLENAIQELSYVDYITSVSKPGLSQITVEMKSTYRKDDLAQIWDELRRKINDHKAELPPGTGEPMVRDDFADVYGILLAISGDGYSYQDIRDYTEFLRRELVLVDGIGKVTMAGKQQEQVMVEVSRAKLGNFGIPPQRITELLQTQNIVSDAGQVKIGSESLRIATSGEFTTVQQLADLIISNPGADERIRLRDVATIYRDYKEIPSHLVRFGGDAALWLGVSFADGVNVVEVGERLNQRIDELDYARPIGMDIHNIYNQPAEVERSVSGFMLNLAEAVIIVIIALLLTMGLRSGILIGSVLLITVLGSFIFMYLMDIQLQRVSLGALIIALGMLVDNAIVIAEGMLVNVRRGMSRLDAASQVVEQNKWPLLGATVIAIIAFAPIGLSSDASGEFAGSLFWVLLISLLLSWLTALTLTPFLGNYLYSNTRADTNPDPDSVYDNRIFHAYRAALGLFLRWRKTTVIALLGLLVISVLGFGQVRQAFFPPSTTPVVYVDMWYPQGTDIRATALDIRRAEAFLLKQDEVEKVATTIGQGGPRFTLTYVVEKSYESYGQMIVRATSQEALQELLPRIRSYLYSEHPDVEAKLSFIELGPATPAKIEARFSGSDPAVLRQLAVQTHAIFDADQGAVNVRDDWRQRTKLLRPVFNQSNARRLGVTKEDVNDLLRRNFGGQSVGVYRDGTELLPIVVRPPAEERADLDDWEELQIYSQPLQQFIPLGQVVSRIEVDWENQLILRRDRKRTLTVMADHDILGTETASQVFERVRPQVEALPLPAGYELSWGGEFEAATKAQTAIFGALPLGFLVMFIITVLLFSSIRQAGVLWTTVPLSIIGVTLGLLVMNEPFGFMALLGFLSLSGMLIKNGVVLLEQVKVELAAGKQDLTALMDAAVSRVRPVSMAAATTILGMLPLLFDSFFASMAVVIMFGLGFATVLTLIVVPVMYALVMRVSRS